MVRFCNSLPALCCAAFGINGGIAPTLWKSQSDTGKPTGVEPHGLFLPVLPQILPTLTPDEAVPAEIFPFLLREFFKLL